MQRPHVPLHRESHDGMVFCDDQRAADCGLIAAGRQSITL